MTSFKEADKFDIDAIIAMMRQFYAIDHYPFDCDLTRTMLHTFIDDKHLGKLWLIYSDGNLAGYIVLTFVFSFEYGGKIAFIDELFILSAFRSRGIGRKAIEFLKTAADKLLLKVLYLEIEPHNTTAQKLYIAANFESHSRNLMRYKP